MATEASPGRRAAGRWGSDSRQGPRAPLGRSARPGLSPPLPAPTPTRITPAPTCAAGQPTLCGWLRPFFPSCRCTSPERYRRLIGAAAHLTKCQLALRAEAGRRSRTRVVVEGGTWAPPWPGHRRPGLPRAAASQRPGDSASQHPTERRVAFVSDYKINKC